MSRCWQPGQREEREIPSGSKMTARKMVRDVKRVTKDWDYGPVSIGYPGPVIHGRPLHEPYNLGGGWVGFDFGKAFGCPVKVINDAAMQALGSYQGGRMLFLGSRRWARVRHDRRRNTGADGIGASSLQDMGRPTRTTLVIAPEAIGEKEAGGATWPMSWSGSRTL